jgi:hypothetical protein
VGPSFHFVPCFYSLFFRVLLFIYAWQGFIRCEASEYNESGKLKGGAVRGGERYFRGAFLLEQCIGVMVFREFHIPDLSKAGTCASQVVFF